LFKEYEMILRAQKSRPYAVSVFALILTLTLGLIAAGSITKPAAEITTWTPQQPKWGESLEVTYDPGAPKAAFLPGDEVYAIYFFPPSDQKGWIRLEKEGDVLKGRIPIEKDAGYITVHFITREGWDRNAQLGIMVRRTDGQPARGAYRQEMLNAFSPETYLSIFEKERSLYPDSYAVYRDKWFMEGALKRNELKAIVEKDLPALEEAAAQEESAELLYALSYGNLLLDREEAGRKLLARMVEIYPADFYTTYAFSNYNYQVLSKQWKGEGPEAVKQLAIGLIVEDPTAKNVRSLFERRVLDEGLTMKTVESVCRAWIKDEPENPNPYFYYGLAAKSKGGDLEEAERRLGTGLRHLLEGKLRLHGDIGGAMTGMRIPAFYALRAEIRRDLGAYAEALADIKAAMAVSKETRPDHLVIEASIWSNLGHLEQAETILSDAYKMGNKDAEEALREIYVRRQEDTSGIDEYLAGILEGGDETAQEGAPGGAGARGVKGVASTARKSAAPDFAVQALDGNDLKLSELKGKAVVLNFWFIGCAPCRVEMPGLNSLVEEFDGKDIAFIGFALDPADKLREFLKDHSFDYTIVPGSTKIAELFGVSVYPTHILINKQGRIEYFLTGGSPERHEQLKPLIENLLR
jgi:peroxiredoxin